MKIAQEITKKKKHFFLSGRGGGGRVRGEGKRGRGREREWRGEVREGKSMSVTTLYGDEGSTESFKNYTIHLIISTNSNSLT